MHILKHTFRFYVKDVLFGMISFISAVQLLQIPLLYTCNFKNYGGIIVM